MAKPSGTPGTHPKKNQRPGGGVSKRLISQHFLLHHTQPNLRRSRYPIRVYPCSSVVVYSTIPPHVQAVNPENLVNPVLIHPNHPRHTLRSHGLHVAFGHQKTTVGMSSCSSETIPIQITPRIFPSIVNKKPESPPPSGVPEARKASSAAVKMAKPSGTPGTHPKKEPAPRRRREQTSHLPTLPLTPHPTQPSAKPIPHPCLSMFICGCLLPPPIPPHAPVVNPENPENPVQIHLFTHGTHLDPDSRHSLSVILFQQRKKAQLIAVPFSQK